MKKLLYILSISMALGACSSNQSKDKTDQTAIEESTAPQAMSKSEAEQIESDLKTYIGAFNAQDWKTVTDMMYPRLFDKVSKEVMIQSFEGMEINITTDLKSIDLISPKLSLDSTSFCHIYYNGTLEIELLPAVLDNRQPFLDQMIKAFGQENITEIREDLIHVNSHKSMIGIQNNKSGQWSYMEYTGNNDPFLASLLPMDAVEFLSGIEGPAI